MMKILIASLAKVCVYLALSQLNEKQRQIMQFPGAQFRDVTLEMESGTRSLKLFTRSPFIDQKIFFELKALLTKGRT